MASEKVKTLTDADFGDSVKAGVVLVDFWAEWCAPCRRLSPVIEQLAQEYAGRLRVAKVDVDANPSTAAKMSIRAMPTLLFLKGGRVRNSLVGPPPDRRSLAPHIEALLEA